MRTTGCRHSTPGIVIEMTTISKCGRRSDEPSESEADVKLNNLAFNIYEKKINNKHEKNGLF